MYDAWKSKGNMSKESAMKGYVQALSKQVPGWRKRAKL